MPLRSEDEETAPKKPRRARNWALGCFSTLFLFGLIVAGYVAWASMLPPPTPFPQAMMPSPNGYDAMLAVLPRVAGGPGNAEVSEGRISIEKLRPAVRQQKPYLDELRATLKLPFRNPVVHDPNSDYLQPMAQFRQAARALAAEARIGLADGQAAKGWSSGLDAVELGAKVHRGGVLIHHLVGVAVCAIGLSRIDGQAEKLTAEEARSTRRRVERITAEVPPLAEIIREEHRVSELWFRKAATDPPMLQPEFDGEEVTWQEKSKRVALRYFYPKAWAAASLKRYWESTAREAEKPAWQRVSPPQPTDPYLEQMFIDPLAVTRHHTRLQAELDLLQLQLALREHRARFGAYPAALGELAKLGVKPLADRFTGKPYVYRRTAGGYLLYSAGQNGTDDGGTPASRANPESGDLVAGKLFPGR